MSAGGRKPTQLEVSGIPMHITSGAGFSICLKSSSVEEDGQGLPMAESQALRQSGHPANTCWMKI